MGSNDPANTWPKIYFTSCRSFWNTPPSDIYPKSITIILFGSGLGCFICPGNFNNKDQGCRRMCSPNIWNQVYFYDVTFDCKSFEFFIEKYLTDILNWGASSRWSFPPISARGSIETTTMRKMLPTLLF